MVPTGVFLEYPVYPKNNFRKLIDIHKTKEKQTTYHIFILYRNRAKVDDLELCFLKTDSNPTEISNEVKKFILV